MVRYPQYPPVRVGFRDTCQVSLFNIIFNINSHARGRHILTYHSLSLHLLGFMVLAVCGARGAWIIDGSIHRTIMHLLHNQRQIL
ncbi:hypothetical protein SERLA73DRAFT_134770, partial [Serpula lacrymans var. lacrymans S7.3]